MLRSVKELEGYKIAAKDDEIGKVYDFFFDDEQWIIRYLVVDTGTWLPGRRVLISPGSMGKPDWNAEIFPVDLTKKQVEESPEIDEHQPLERRKELELTSYYGWPNYWTGIGGPAIGAIPPVPASDTNSVAAELENIRREEKEENEDTHLRSTKSIIDYSIEGTDESIGHVEDFIIDDANWMIRYIVVDTRNWLPGGKKVIVSSRWIKRMDWVDSRVYIDLTKDQIKNSPEWDSSKSVERDYETKLHEHYRKKIYW